MTHAARRDTGFRFGPVLIFRGEQGERWRLSALFGVDGEEEPEDLDVDGVRLPVPPRHLTQWKSVHLWRFDFAVPRPPNGSTVAYGFPEREPWQFHVPAMNSRLAFAYVSLTAANAVHCTAPWTAIGKHLDRATVHLLVQGGGQLDASSVWIECPSLAAWRSLPPARRWSEAFTPAMAQEVFGYLFDRYLALWSRADFATITARLPSILMWNDADAFPGLAEADNMTALTQVGRGVALAARRTFSLFQLGARMEALPESVWGGDNALLTRGFRLGDTGLLALDLYSGQHPNVLAGQLSRLADCRRLLVTTPTPLLAPVGGMPSHLLPWRRRPESPDLFASAQERQELISHLIAFAGARRCRVTVLSGGCGLRAVLRGSGAELWQVAASSAPNAPSGLVGWFNERRAARSASPLPGHHFEALPFARSRRRLSHPCWLTLTTSDTGGLDLCWHLDGETNVLTI